MRLPGRSLLPGKKKWLLLVDVMPQTQTVQLQQEGWLLALNGHCQRRMACWQLLLEVLRKKSLREHLLQADVRQLVEVRFWLHQCQTQSLLACFARTRSELL